MSCFTRLLSFANEAHRQCEIFLPTISMLLLCILSHFHPQRGALSVAAADFVKKWRGLQQVALGSASTLLRAARTEQRLQQQQQLVITTVSATCPRSGPFH